MARRDWVDDHIARYQATGGEDGHIWPGRDGKQQLPCLLITTTGANSGKATTTALIYGTDGVNPVIIASTGGAPKNPQWYENLAADPNVKVQVKADKFDAVARTATGAERARLWDMMAKIFPTYNQYHESAKQFRQIPVVVLERR